MPDPMPPQFDRDANRWLGALVLAIVIATSALACSLLRPASAQEYSDPTLDPSPPRARPSGPAESGGELRNGAICETYRITGYVRGAHSPWTADGTSVWTRESIAAASWNVPMGALVQVDGLGTFRVADRGGGLGARHVDILVDTVSEAYALTGWRQVCVLS